MKTLWLISQAVHGSRAALEELVQLYYDNIYQYLFFRVQNRETAEDLTQDVFVKLTKSLHLYRPTASFSAYLYRIAHNTLVDYYRSYKQTEPLGEAGETDPMNQVEARLDAQRLLAQLPEEQRTCLELYYLQGLTFREVAQVLQVPIPTAKSRVQRGLAACRKRMEEHHG